MYTCRSLVGVTKGLPQIRERVLVSGIFGRLGRERVESIFGDQLNLMGGWFWLRARLLRTAR